MYIQFVHSSASVRGWERRVEPSIICILLRGSKEDCLAALQTDTDNHSVGNMCACTHESVYLPGKHEVRVWSFSLLSVIFLFTDVACICLGK